MLLTEGDSGQRQALTMTVVWMEFKNLHCVRSALRYTEKEVEWW